VEEGVTEKLNVKRQKAKSYYDRGAKLLPELEVGQEVRVAGNAAKAGKLVSASRNCQIARA